MSDPRILSLTDCVEFKQTLRTRPPRMARALGALLVLLLAVALAWAAWTKVNLVVRAPGLVRPVRPLAKVINTASGDAFSAAAGTRITKIHYRLGGKVRKGMVLLRLDTSHIDQQIAMRRRAVRRAEDELVQLDRLRKLHAEQYRSTRAKAEADLAQAQKQLRQAKLRQASDTRVAERQLRHALDELERARGLSLNNVVTAAELDKLEVELRTAQEGVEKARLPVDDGRIEIVYRTLAATEKDHAVTEAEWELQQRTKLGELDAAQSELSRLELERQQAVLRSPCDGIATQGEWKVGDILERGQVAVAVAVQQGYLFEAAVPTEEIGHLRKGMPVRLKLDAYDFQRYGTLPGKVVFVSPDSKLDGPEGKQRVAYTVKILLERSDIGRGPYRGQVRLGMQGIAEIVTDQRSLLSVLVKRIRQSISLG